MIQNFTLRIDDAMQIRAAALQSMWRSLWNVMVFMAAGWQCAVADGPLDVVQRRVTSICQNLHTATVRIRSGSDVSSGVIVSETGLVLSVAHGLTPRSDTATVLFPGGKTCEAKRVVVNEQADFALLVMDVASLTDVDWSIVPVQTSGFSVLGEVVVASGFPAREPDGMLSVVRLGEIVAVDQLAVKTSCILTTGDSGGPLVNSRGELIGLHRQIGVGTEENGHVALAAIRRALEKTSHWKSLTQQGGADAILFSKQLAPGPQVVTATRSATVEIHGSDAGGRSSVRVLGTVLDQQEVATKLSEIFPYSALMCRFADGSTIAATLSKSDRTLDLAILKLASPYENGNAAISAVSVFQNSTVRCGHTVFAATSPYDVAAAGMIGRVGHDETPLPARFGATMQSDAERVHITELSPNGSAVLAGLLVGDVLHQVDATDISSLQAMGFLLMGRQPGDWITIDVHRAMKRLDVQAQLQHDPREQYGKTEYLDGRTGRVSQRRSGFFAVLQHDIAMEPAACGGPLVDIEGHIVAINIARRARESTLAIPIEDVQKFANSE